MSDHIGFIWPVWERERVEESSLQAAKSKLTKSRKTQREKHDVNMVKMKYTDDVEAKWITNARWWGMLLKWHKNFVTIFTEAIILLMKLLPHNFFSLSLCRIPSMLCTHTHRHSIICFGIIYFFLARFLVGDVDLFRVVSFSFASLRDNLERPRCDTYYESIIGIYEITKCGLCPWANKCTPFMK